MLLTDPSANSNSDTDTDAVGGDTVHRKELTKVRALYMSKVFATEFFHKLPSLTVYAGQPRVTAATTVANRNSIYLSPGAMSEQRLLFHVAFRTAVFISTYRMY